MKATSIEQIREHLAKGGRALAVLKDGRTVTWPTANHFRKELTMPIYHCVQGVETTAIGKDGRKLVHGIRDTVTANSKDEAAKSFARKHGIKPDRVSEIKVDGR